MKLKYLPFYLASFLPFTVLYFLSDVTFFILYHIVQYRRSVVKQNLKNSFPTYNTVEIQKIEIAFYHHFCDIIFETLKSLSLNPDNFQKRLIVKNIDVIKECYSNGRSAILYAGHFGNWEWISILPLSIQHQLTSFYQPLSNKYFDEITKIARERFGAVCVESNKGYKSIVSFELQNVLTLNLMIGDQCPRKDSAKHWTQFLNQETAFLVGADKIAKKADHVLLFPCYKKIKRGYYEIELKVLSEHPNKLKSDEIIDAFAKELEHAICESPELWLWSHRRWKLKPEEATYN